MPPGGLRTKRDTIAMWHYSGIMQVGTTSDGYCDGTKTHFAGMSSKSTIVNWRHPQWGPVMSYKFSTPVRGSPCHRFVSLITWSLTRHLPSHANRAVHLNHNPLHEA